MSARWAFGIATCCALAACGDLVVFEAPIDDYELPEPDLSLDPERIRTGAVIAHWCYPTRLGDQFAELRGVYRWRLVDIYAGTSTDERMPEENVDVLESIGTRVLYRFNIPAVRARVLDADIERIVRSLRWATVRDVPDDTRYDVPDVFVSFVTSAAANSVDLSESGARLHERVGCCSIAADFPDRVIPDVRELADVESVEVGGGGCVGV